MIDDGRGDRGADHIVSVYARTDQIQMLLALTGDMDVWMHSRPRRILGAGVMIDYVCGNADIAAEFTERWSGYCGDW